MLKVKQLKRFKKDYAQYTRDIESISNQHIKDECKRLLNELVAEYSFIDASHSTSMKDIDPSNIRENVVRTIDLRNKLNKFIKESKSL